MLRFGTIRLDILYLMSILYSIYFHAVGYCSSSLLSVCLVILLNNIRNLMHDLLQISQMGVAHKLTNLGNIVQEIQVGGFGY